MAPCVLSPWVSSLYMGEGADIKYDPHAIEARRQAAWRERDARPAELSSARYWTDLVSEAERGMLDFVTIEDGLTLQFEHPLRADERTDRVRGRLDAVLIASRVAPVTSHIGLIPTAITTHTEPFHLSKAIATLDYVSSGRAGIRVQASASPVTARVDCRRVE